ncbi:MAG: PSD1 domain-containing protein [Verrucomicrobia bacterium]|nr:PSD1 domain-containing protein [Verrucomicrobiota bacterium]
MRFCVLWAVGLPLSVLSAASSADGKVDFQRDVRPILSRNCFACHGPDDKARKAKLRLDLRDEALKPAKSGEHPLVPGKPDQSEVVRRIFSQDHDEVMPPPEAKKNLTAAERETLRKWIAAGADYKPHWAFVPPKQSAPPSVKQKGWVCNPIDNFILARLEKEKLKPSPPADAYTLVRRLYLDLIGLPPTPEEVEAFVRDFSPATGESGKAGKRESGQRAVEALADKLLASPHYGERWARKWLDLARYADTNGYEKDRPRNIWPWRDWVIHALNADMPFDRFTIEQLAGDLLLESQNSKFKTQNLSPLIATGFHRNSMLNEEGGIDPLEFRFYAMVDRVAVTGTTWLGLTTQCAQCHTHKFDPIPHREYYSLMAFLNSADEPEIDLPNPDITAQRKAQEEKIAKLVTGLAEKFPVGTNSTPSLPPREHLEQKFSAWLEAERTRSVNWQVLKPAALKANLALLTPQPDHSVLATGDQSKSDTYELKFRVPAGATAFRLEAIPDDRLPEHGPGAVYYEGPRGDFFLSEFTASAGGAALKFASATDSYGKAGIGRGTAQASNCIDGDQQSGWSINGGQGQRHVAVFNLAQPLAAAGEVEIKMLFEKHYAAPLGRFRISVTTDSAKPVARAFEDEVERLLLVPDAQLTAVQREQLRRTFLLNAPELAAARAEIEKLKKAMPELPTTLVLKERPKENPRATFIHNRGEFLQPTEKVEPGTLSALNPLPADAPRNRLTFAKWLVSPENPLTARVTVNRQWHILFGRGLVRTTEDFGLMGEVPSHPELLDWLAVEFVKQGWSLKKLHKLIVTSATYQQSSRVTPELTAKDPNNILLARAPRVRVEAEMIRDATLRASGLLSPKIGGPSVFPPQPASVTSEGVYGVKSWDESKGEDRYRRGLYTFTKRSAPFAMFNTFDAPSGEACVARRDISNTPLQALTLLNDVTFTEASQAMGKLLASRAGTVEERVAYAFRRVLTRPASKDEVAMLAKFFETQKQRFVAKELDAAKISGPGEGDANERAAWAALARALFNLDEAITKG